MIQSPFRVIIVFLAVSIIGFAFIPRLSVQWLPSERSPYLSVRVSWANASPTAIEQEVITPLEGAFNLIQGIKSIYSISNNEEGTLRLELDKKADLDYLRFEVAAKIRQLYPELPKGVSFPQVLIYNPDEAKQSRPMLTYALSGSDDPSVLYQYASEVLNPKLALTGGLQSINVAGGNQTEWRITYDENLLSTLGLKEQDLITSLEQQFQQKALGLARIGDQQLSIRLDNARAKTEKEALLLLPIKKVEGRMIRLSDIASISFEDQPPQRHYRINGRNSIRLLLYPQQGVNTLQLAQQIKREVAVLAATLKNGYQLRLEDDATAYLSDELYKIAQRTLLSLVILLLFVLVVYRSWRYLLIVLMSLVVNLGFAFILYDWLSVELHLYALAGITVSFGIIIDNSIVMMHHLKHQGNLKVFPALLASTLTTISALTVIWFLPDKWQINLLDFAKVISINLGVSLLVALLFIPALMQTVHIKKSKERKNYNNLKKQVRINSLYYKILFQLIKRKPLVITGILLLFGLPVFLLPNRVEDQEWYNKSLGNEWYVDKIKPVVNRALGGTLRLFMWYVYEGATYREANETMLYVEGGMPPGTTLKQMNEVFRQIEQYVGQYQVEVKQFTTQISDGQYGRMQILFNPSYDSFFPYQLKDRLTAYALNLGGIKWSIYGVGKGFNNAAGSRPPRFMINIMGYNKEILEKQAQRFADRLLKHPRIQEVNTEANINWWEKDLYEYELNIDKQRLAQQNIQPIQLTPILNNFNKVVSSDARLPSGEPIRLINNKLIKNDLWILKNELQEIDSSKVALSSFAFLGKQKVSSSIHKENQQYIRTVEFEYTGSSRFGSKYLDEVMETMKKEMPLGYSMERNTWSFGSEQKKQYSLFLLVIGLIAFVCAIMFESTQQAFNIILLIPISFIGIFLTFYWFDFPFDQGGYTSFIFLSGIVVNSLILIINDFNNFRKLQPYRSSLSLYIKAFNHKITPILLTIFSTSLGLIPFLIHGQQEVFWFSLAVGSIGGLLFSIIMITFFIPVFFVKRSQL